MSAFQTGRRGPGAGGESVPDIVAPPPLHPRFPLTVGMRGIPALAIIVGHAWFFTGGFGGFTEACRTARSSASTASSRSSSCSRPSSSTGR